MNKNMKKLFLFIVTVITVTLCLAFSAGALDATGQCGDDAYWSFNASTGELDISGSGDMWDWYGTNNPFVGNSIVSAVIGDGITSIGENTFYDCTGLESVILPDSLKSIDSFAFQNCTALTDINLPYGLETIDNCGFYRCSALTAVSIPGSVLCIGNNAFGSCSGLTEIIIPDSVKIIDHYAFYYCTELKNITIPDNIESVGAEILAGTAYCNDESNWENGVLYAGNHFIKAKEDTSGSCEVKEGTKTIAAKAFYNCSNLTAVKIPSALTSIGFGAFMNCSKLESVNLTSALTVIEESVFSGCKNLKEITIPDNVKTINRYAFRDCVELKDVYYSGSPNQWKEIQIGAVNDYLLNAEIHYGKSDECLHSNLTTLKAVAATCIKTGKTAGKKCSDCGKITVAQKTVAKKAHTYKTTVTKATLTKNGKSVKKCTACGYIQKTTVINAAKTVKLSIASYTYDGKVKTPGVIVKDSKGNTLKKDTDYTVKYATGRKNPGKYTVTVTFKGNYTGTKKLTVTIKPAAPRITKLTSTKKGTAALTWTNVAGETGYEVYFATSKNGTYKKLGTRNANVVTGSKSGLTSGKTYYFKVRAYKTTNSGAVYSAWSAVKSVKIK